MGEMPPSGTYYRRPMNPTARATRWILLLAAVLTITVLGWAGVSRTHTRSARAAAPYTPEPVRTAHLVEQIEPLHHLHPVQAVVQKETPRSRPRPVGRAGRADPVGPKPRHSPRPRPPVHVKTVKKPRASVNALCARQFPDDLRLRSACVLFLS
jgi:hypothetical protein